MNERVDSMSSFEHVQLDDESCTGQGEAQRPSDTPQAQKPSSPKGSAAKPEQQQQQRQQTKKKAQKQEGPAAEDHSTEPAASAVAPPAAGASPAAAEAAAAPEAGPAQQSLASVLGFFGGAPLEGGEEERGPGEEPDAVGDFEREAIEAAKEAAHAAQEVRRCCWVGRHCVAGDGGWACHADWTDQRDVKNAWPAPRENACLSTTCCTVVSAVRCPALRAGGPEAAAWRGGGQGEPGVASPGTFLLVEHST